MFGQSLLSGAFGSSILDPGLNFNTKLYTGNGSGLSIGGKIKGAASFNGSSSLISIPGSSSISQQNNFTLSFWVKPSGFVAYGTVLTLFSDYRNYVDIRTNGILTFNATGSSVNTPSSSITDGVWQHIAITKSSTAGTVIYVNGSSVVTDASDTGNASDFSSYSYSNYVGAYTTPSDFFPGSIDQLRIYNSVLSTSQVDALYAETAATADTLDFPAGAGGVAAYTLDANANDVSFNGTTDVSTCDFPTGAGCEALYQFENNVTDTCGNYDGTARSITYTSGLFSDAATFSGGTNSNASTGSQIYINNSVWGGNTSTFSVSLWFKGSTTPGETPLIGNGGTIGGTIGFAIYTTANGNLNGTLCSTGSGGTQVFFGNTTNISDNQWHHIAFTFDNSSSGAYVLYLDNQSHASGTTTAFTGNPTPTYNTYIGNRWNRNENGVINGQIDQVRIFNSVLTQSQVTQLARGAQYNGLSTDVTYNGFLNFQPDFTWIKHTNEANDHVLTDAVRGVSEVLYSNSRDGNTPCGEITSFDPYGFSLQYNTGCNVKFNKSGGTYISWNWKAGNTSAAAFNGSNSVIEVSSSTLNPANVYTVSMWVKFTNASTYTGFFTNNTSAYRVGEISIIKTNATKLQIFSVGSAGTNLLDNLEAQPSSSFVNNTWYNIVVISDRSISNQRAKVYVNGTECSYIHYGANQASVSAYSATRIGMADGQFISGRINQVRLFNTGLSSTQITDLYGETASNNDTLNFPAGAGCTAAYTLNSTVADVGGNYNGTATAITYAKPGYTGINNDGSIESQVSANQDAGFSIVSFTSTGVAGVVSTGHGLSAEPELVIFKNLDATSYWLTYHKDVGDNGYLALNDTFAIQPFTPFFDITSTTIGVRQSSLATGTTEKCIAYCWHSVDKYSKIGSFAGTNATHAITGLGFAPRYVMIKCVTSAGPWVLQDKAMNPSNPAVYHLRANSNGAQDSGAGEQIDFDDNGFTINYNACGNINCSGDDYIYMAFA